MIDRKALWIFIAVFLAMTGAAIWQLSLLPDWRHMPLGAPSSHNAVSGLALFATPASLLLFMVSPFIQWLALPKEALPALRRWSGKWIVALRSYMGLCPVFALTCSLGIVSPSGPGIARAGSVMIGIMFMIIGNVAPKTPVPPQRNSFELDSWNANRMFRFAGKLLVGLGLAFVLGGMLLPLEYWESVFGSVMLTALAAGIWYGIKLRHERSLQIKLRHERSLR
jgi:hypothetical protein